MKKEELFIHLITTLILTMIMSFVITIVNTGLENFRYLSYLKSLLIAFVLINVLLFIIPKFINKLYYKVKSIIFDIDK
ncbi:DUF2798 domain-containing protein [Listeria monocytogenes]|uniref:DUF2798 domain-containing protein n=1 Tax=Listeria monocytogenes TaxID=1639 RepID=UPI000873A134|nr:DUF2798 domain-containing protein [Listeria monocytogenes]EAC8000829.1 DUF2798 domain-containing protein [Listeria monocytogenes]EAC8350987.1 DUF2798 domain-containing protein [Listeria monocytogenes]EAD4096260.1 DUF2798 domain-containing protein [Listeria monocytogenes]EAD9140591.1 DUF2798 domain-containing protein [Listeria monocytogenes]EAE6933751.1 DUF2798 domain-containing protein [Listeria monocytogenes]